MCALERNIAPTHELHMLLEEQLINFYDTVPFIEQASNDDHILQSCLNLHSKVDKLKANQTGKYHKKRFQPSHDFLVKVGTCYIKKSLRM